MKKALKTTGIVLAVLAGLLLVAFLLIRFVFQDRIEDYCLDKDRIARVELLRTAAPYARDTCQYRFTYAQDTVRAREIRNYFRLDTLVDPAATTWDNTLSLARFVARNIPHANQTIYPERCNATGLWEYSRNVEPAFNCRLHAIMLHELLLACGITNRFVTCLPADSLDSDCHVVNIVWLGERQKWAMVDSDMDAYLTDPDGVPLSLAEMRERYIDGDPMEIHPLTGVQSDFAFYRAYWPKNLYLFECWEDTGYDKEVACEGRTVTLLPPGFTVPAPRRPRAVTSDADRFWAAPEPDDIQAVAGVQSFRAE